MKTTTQYPSAAGWKTEQPETSRNSAIKVESKAKTLRDKCYEALKGAAMTADECAELLGKGVLSIRPRFSELVAQRKVVDTGERRKNTSGHSAVVWQSVEQRIQVDFL